MGISNQTASIVQGVMDTGGGILNGILNRRYGREMAKYAYDQELAQWNRENQYNSPSAQMERLKEAGLNPNLVYGTGVQAAGQASHSPKYNVPQGGYNVQAPNVLGTLEMYQNLELKQAQIDNVKAQTTNIIEKTKTQGFITMLKDVDFNKQKWELGDLNNMQYNAEEKLWHGDSPFAIRSLNELEMMRKQSFLTEAKIKQIEEGTKGIENDNLYKAWRNELNKEGMNVNDSLGARAIYKMLKDSGQLKNYSPAMIMSLITMFGTFIK